MADSLSPEHHPRTSVPLWNPFYWPAGVWALVIGAAILSVPFGIRAIKLAGIPAIQQPYDEVEFLAWDVEPEDDAFTDYQRAFELLNRQVEIKGRQDPDSVATVLEQGWSAADESLVQWLEFHREPLRIWRRGTEKQRGRNLSPAKLRADTNIQIIQEQRRFVRLALIEQARSLEAGKLDEAWQWARAAQRAGGHATHRGPFIQGLVGWSLHHMSSQGLQRWAERPEVTSEQLIAALRKTRSDYALYESRGNILKSEFQMLENTLSDGQWLAMFGPQTGADGASVAVKVRKFGYWVVAEPELTVRLMRQVLANQLPEIDKPLATRRKKVGSGAALLFDPDPAKPLLPGQLDSTQLDRAINGSMLYRTVIPSFKRTEEVMLRQEARQLTLEILLAAQAYRRDHAEFPQDATQLVPQYLDAIPLDPSDPAGGAIRYRRTDAHHAVVWGLGEDGTDGDGDVAPAANGRSGDVGFLLK